MRHGVRGLVAAAGLALVAGSACILIERYEPPVPDPPDAGGGSGGTTSTSTSSTSSSSGAGGTATTTSSTTSNSGGSGGSTTTSSSSSSSASSTSSSGMPGTAIWSKSFGGTLDDGANDVAADGAGSVILVGTFQDSIDFGGGVVTSAGQGDAFVVKLDSAGGHIWTRRYGDSLSQFASGVALDGANNIYVAGAFQGGIDFGAPSAPLASAGQADMFLAKLTPGGGTTWAKRYGDATQQSMIGHALAVAPNGDLFVAGILAGTMDLGNGPLVSAGSDDVYLARLDTSGNAVWSHAWGDGAAQTVRGLARASNGDLAVVGTMSGTLDFGAGVLDAGTSTDVFVAVFSSAGVVKWSKRFGDATSAQTPRSIVFDPAGTVWIGGSFSGTLDLGGGPLTAVGAADNLFVARFGDNGAHLVSKAFGDGAAPGQSVRRLAADSLGQIVIGGDFAGSLDFGSGPIFSAGSLDALLVKASPTLVPAFARQYGDGSVQIVSAVAVDPADDILLVGSLRGVADIGNGPLPNAGGSDAFIAKVAP